MTEPNNVDRLAAIEANLAAHRAKFEERERAEGQAERERALAAAAIQDALKEASTTSGKALEAAAKAQAEALQAALKNANELELERVGRVGDEVKAVKTAAVAALEDSKLAQAKFENGVKERFATVNEFRGSLEDLGKSMGTRRELEQAQESFRVAHDGLAREVNQLRSRIDIGPADLKELQRISDRGEGNRQRGSEISASNRIDKSNNISMFVAIASTFVGTFIVIGAIVAVVKALGG